DATALAWLENALLSMEQAGAIDVTREYHPPHLHVAVFPERYRAWAARQDSLHPPAVAAATVQHDAVARAATLLMSTNNAHDSLTIALAAAIAATLAAL